MTFNVVRRPSESESAPERIRPPALPNAAIVIANVAASTVSPTERMNGTSWLIIIWPAVVPRQYAIHSAQKVGVRIISPVERSVDGRFRAATDAAGAGTLWSIGGFFSSAVPI